MPVTRIQRQADLEKSYPAFSHLTKTPSLCGRIVERWRDILLMTASAVAAAGCALAFFAGLALYYVAGFAFLAIACLIAAHYLKKYPLFMKIENVLGAITKQHEDLSATSKDLKKTATRMGAENTRLTEQNARLQLTTTQLESRLSELTKQVDLLRRENHTLHTTHEALQTTHDELRRTHDGLGKTHEQLEKTHAGLEETHRHLLKDHEDLKRLNAQLTLQIAQLTASAHEIKKLVAGFKAENEIFKEGLHELSTSSAGIEDSRKALEKDVARYEKELVRTLSDLDRQLKASRTLCDTISSSLSASSSSFAQGVRELQGLITDLRTDGSTVEKIKQLGELQAQSATAQRELATAAAELREIQANAALQRQKLETLHKDYELERQRIAEERAKLAAENVKLSTTSGRLDASVTALSGMGPRLPTTTPPTRPSVVQLTPTIHGFAQ